MSFRENFKLHSSSAGSGLKVKGHSKVNFKYGHNSCPIYTLHVSVETWYMGLPFPENFRLDRSSAGNGLGVKGHSKVNLKYGHISYSMHMTGLKLGIWICLLDMPLETI